MMMEGYQNTIFLALKSVINEAILRINVQNLLSKSINFNISSLRAPKNSHRPIPRSVLSQNRMKLSHNDYDHLITAKI